MYPHERSLVERLKDQPFALIGVNSDNDREALQEALEKEKITWRSFWNGGGTDGPISAQYRVQGWPTIYLLDHQGIIRYKDDRGEFVQFPEKLDKLIDELLAGVESAGS